MNKPAFSIYDASAGAGKTYTLVLEYLKIILSSPREDAYRNILAITFTNKAVHEMKSRIVDSLSAFAAAETPGRFQGILTHIAKDLGVSEESVRQKARKIIRHIIHNYAAFDISTIDKFTHRVIRTFAHDLNLPVTFEVSLDTENVLTEAVDAIIAQAGEDPTLTRLLVDFTMEKTDADKSWDISRELLDTGRLILNENNRNEVVQFRDRTIDEFNLIKERIRGEANRLEQQCIKLAQEALDLIRQNGIEFKSFFRGIIPKFFEKVGKGGIIRNIDCVRYLEGIECNRYSASTPAQQKALVDEISGELLGKLEKINEAAEKYMFYQAFLKNITPLSLLNTVEKEFAKIQQDQNILSIAEFNKIINDQIRDEPAPFIYERLGDRYRHYFIDEFQDTSELQWQNLLPLIDNATSSEWNGERGSIMIVGDPKQSIYRWRGGKAEQFIELAKGKIPFNNKDWRLFTLDTNYRSFSEVIGFNNDFFRFLSAEFDHADYADLYLNKTFQNENTKKGGYVNLSFIPKSACEEDSPDKTEMYVRKVIDIIREVVAKGFSLSDIAILTRKRSEGVAIAAALTEQNMRIISSETLLVETSSDVRCVVDFLKFIRNNRDRESKAGFLQYLAGREKNIVVHDFISDGLAHENESSFQSWLSGFGYAFSLSDLRKRSLYEAVETVISVFIKNRHNAYIQFFLDIVLERDVRGMSGVSDFLEFWSRNSSAYSIPAPQGEDAVRIMTIHKSKGLEFPVVIFPFAEEAFGRKPKEKLWVEADEEVFGLPKILIDNTSAVEAYSEQASALYYQKKEEALLDAVNVLYVALTRAEEQLYIISSMNLSSKGEPPANNLCSFFIKYLQTRHLFDPAQDTYSFGNPAKISEEKEALPKPPSIQPASTTLAENSIRIARRESAMWGTRQQQAIEYGNLVHEIMAMIRHVSDIDFAIRSAIGSGLIAATQADAVANTIQQIVGHPELAKHFDAEARVLTEKVIIRPQGSVLKPDRMAIVGADCYLLDYKTGAKLQKHSDQLQAYADAIGEVGYRVVKKAIVYLGSEVNVVNL